MDIVHINKQSEQIRRIMAANCEEPKGSTVLMMQLLRENMLAALRAGVGTGGKRTSGDVLADMARGE